MNSLAGCLCRWWPCQNISGSALVGRDCRSISPSSASSSSWYWQSQWVPCLLALEGPQFACWGQLLKSGAGVYRLQSITPADSKLSDALNFLGGKMPRISTYPGILTLWELQDCRPINGEHSRCQSKSRCGLRANVNHTSNNGCLLQVPLTLPCPLDKNFLIFSLNQLWLTFFFSV